MGDRDFKKRIRNLPVIRRADWLVQPGDFFVTRAGGGIFRDAIELVQGYRSSDGVGHFNHAGFFINRLGRSFEALARVEEVDFFERHDGELVIVGRHDCMSPGLFWRQYQVIKNQYAGHRYPFYRLLFHSCQAAARALPDGAGVCSEITAHFLSLCDFWSWYKGATPDNIKDWVCDPWQTHIQLVACAWVNRNPYKKQRI